MDARLAITIIPDYSNLVHIKSLDTHSVFYSGDVVIKVYYFTLDEYDNEEIYRICQVHKLLSDKIASYVPVIRAIYQNDFFIAIIMERIDGVNLYRFTQDKSNLTQNNAAKVVSSLVAAITNIHKLGYVHGDFHCGNVLVTNDFNVKIIDFDCTDDKNSVDPSDLLTPKIYMDYLELYCHIARLIFPNLPDSSGAGYLSLISTFSVKDVIGYEDNPIQAHKLFNILDPFKDIPWNIIYPD